MIGERERARSRFFRERDEWWRGKRTTAPAPEETPQTQPPRNCVVVLLTNDACDAYPDRECVMQVIGPHTRVEAENIAIQQPAWTAPHIMRLDQWDDQ